MSFPSLPSLLVAALLVAPSAADAARLANISTRLQVLQGSQVAIAGFVIDGAAPKTVVITAKGPSLAAYGIQDPLGDPLVSLVRMADNETIAANDNWTTAPNAAQISASGFAPSNALESAIMMSLAPGAYTAVVSGVQGATGVGLVEVYEVNRPDVALANISTRGHVGPGADVMIGGFVVTGSGTRKVVITAKGPSLADYGVTNWIPDPSLQLLRLDGTVVAENNNWGASADAEDIAFSGLAPTDSRESAIVATLEPGAYTAMVSGREVTNGTGLVEVYTWDGAGHLAQAGASAVHYGYLGKTYAYHLPRGPNGTYGSGFLQSGPDPLTPTELTIEWGISRVPGDFDYYRSAQAQIGGAMPCGGNTSSPTEAYYWSLAGSSYQCKVDNLSEWYINVRYLNNCPVGTRCPLAYFHSES